MILGVQYTQAMETGETRRTGRGKGDMSRAWRQMEAHISVQVDKQVTKDQQLEAFKPSLVSGVDQFAQEQWRCNLDG
jgi:hypothetical protein